MAQQHRIDAIEQAIIDTLTSDGTIAAYVKTVETLSRQNIDWEKEQFVMEPPFIGVICLAGPQESDDISLKNYTRRFRWALVLAVENLRGAGEGMRGDPDGSKGVLDLVDDVAAALGGTLLTVGSASLPVRLGAVTPEVMDDNLYIYSMEIEVVSDWQN